ncbi:acyl-CoA dehydratase activase-related protein [Anaerovorax odorimutans]|uniref:acyl-CoA dehydratase activase-related protein n=1 Tax=Anaerovorax odorimutans TaxID=109327 RepID=UPI000408B6F0|nr:acyl-CoA dehydratase activase-related protein [Anaerovorax odorimutans]
MRIGIPGGLLYYNYEPFIKTFFDELGVEVKYSTVSNKDILNMGAKNCVDEACLPIKIFHGHVMKLQEDCDYIAVPRIMNCEFGESICPKYEGLPELVASGTKKNNYIFSKPIRMHDKKKFLKSLQAGAKQIGINKKKVKLAFERALESQKNVNRGIDEEEYTYKVFLAGHPCNIYDQFANINLIEKLHKLDIGIITEECVSESNKKEQMKDLIKNPYWLFFINNFGAAKFLEAEGKADGIIYLSSFCCGTDSFTVEMIKNNLKHLPMLVLKLDEQTGEAGYDTRLEAFKEMLEMKSVKNSKKGVETFENNISSYR